jgi:hypothetical protein
MAPFYGGLQARKSVAEGGILPHLLSTSYAIRNLFG